MAKSTKDKKKKKKKSKSKQVKLENAELAEPLLKKKEKKKKSSRSKKKDESVTVDAVDVIVLENDHDQFYDDYGYEKGTQQKNFVRDFFAIALFLVHLAAVGFVAYKYGGPVLQEEILNPLTSKHFNGYIEGAIVLSIVSVGVGTVIVRIMLNFAGSLIKSILFLLALLGGLLLTTPSEGLTTPIAGMICLMIAGYSAMTAWKKIPFATENLVTAITCLKTNFGVFYLCIAYVVLMFFFTVMWLTSLIGAHDQTKTCQKGHCPPPPKGQPAPPCPDICSPTPLIIIVYLISFIWTYQIIVNCVKCTVAAVVYKWWQTDERLPTKCIDQNAKDSVKKTLSYNFGSMCWGSLITPYIDNVNQVINPDGDLDTGITECFPRRCVDGFEKATRNFTQWGFIYVGMYGYGYNDSCRRVANMFKDRGWLNASNDHTLRNIFLLSTIIIAFVMGEIGKTVGNNTDWFDKEDAEFEARVLGVATGFVFGSILLSVLIGAILSVIILFAQRGDELLENHEDIFIKMETAYKKAYPSLDLRIYHDMVDKRQMDNEVV